MIHTTKLPNNEHSTTYPLGYSESIKVYESKSDVDIWNAFNREDEIAFNYIYSMYVTVLFKCEMSRNHNHFQDCGQNIFVDLRRKRGQLNEAQSIKAYLFNFAMLRFC
jgi:RNA polymerase sigma-70 factor (ECF subfamily)